MGRQGFAVDGAVKDIQALTRISHIDIEGIATHFPAANEPDHAFTQDQIKQFKHVLRDIEKKGIPFETAHAANSAAVVNYPASHFDMVRPGLMTYGVAPATTPTRQPLKPVLRWETGVTQVRRLEAGTSVGYGRTYTTRDTLYAAILPVGYADGYRHGLGNTGDVLIHGHRCPVRGSVCMDQTVVDVTHLPRTVQPGDTATLIGQDGNERVTAEELAERCGTIAYEILTGIGPRVGREYVGEEAD